MASAPENTAARSPMLLEVVRDSIRVRHYSRRAERAYTYWIARFVRFTGRRHPREVGAPEVEAFLTDLAVNGKVSAPTQTQALSALLFLYREVLGVDLPWLDGLVRAKPSKHVPTVLTPSETSRLLARIEGTYGLMARLLYGSGMRLMECVRLRVKDLDFERREIVVRQGKGGKDRVTMLPASLVVPLQEQLARVRVLFDADRERGLPGVAMPDALERKYPGAALSWAWFWVFPARDVSVDSRTGSRRRHHVLRAESATGDQRGGEIGQYYQAGHSPYAAA